MKLRTQITMNRRFVIELLSAKKPAFGLGLLEEAKCPVGFFALCPSRSIPNEVTDRGMRFGHCLMGTSEYLVLRFMFHFYGFHTFEALVSPNEMVQAVLSRMLETEDYFFFVINPDQSVISFHAQLENEDMAGLKANFPRIRSAATTEAQYRTALASFQNQLDPESTLLQWVNQNEMDYLDLTQDHLDLLPS